jgi:hypothetical protein
LDSFSSGRREGCDAAVLASTIALWKEAPLSHAPHTMTTTPACRVCAAPVELDVLTCPHCAAPRPALASWEGEGYEWTSRATWLGAPLLHVAFGIDREGKLRTARGLIAIGQQAVGGVAVGIVARGFVSFGVVSFGVISFGIASLGAVAAVGINAVAPIAWGLAAIGFYAGGVAPFGWKMLGATALQG